MQQIRDETLLQLFSSSSLQIRKLCVLKQQLGPNTRWLPKTSVSKQWNHLQGPLWPRSSPKNLLVILGCFIFCINWTNESRCKESFQRCCDTNTFYCVKKHLLDQSPTMTDTVSFICQLYLRWQKQRSAFEFSCNNKVEGHPQHCALLSNQDWRIRTSLWPESSKSCTAASQHDLIFVQLMEELQRKLSVQMKGAESNTSPNQSPLTSL